MYIDLTKHRLRASGGGTSVVRGPRFKLHSQDSIDRAGRVCMPIESSKSGVPGTFSEGRA